MRLIEPALLAALLLTPAAGAAPKAKPTAKLALETQLTTPFSKPTHAVPVVKAQSIDVNNARASATLFAVRCYQRAGLFAAAQRIAKDSTKKKLGLDASATSAVARFTKLDAGAAAVADFPQFVSDLLAAQFAAIVQSSVDQMQAYEDLVSSVADTVDQFTDDNLGSERDHLRNEALVLSNAGYGAAHFAAVQLSKQADAALEVVEQPSIQKAYGARSAAELIAKLGKSSTSQVTRELSRAEVGSQLLLWAAEHAQLDPAKIKASAAAKKKLASAWRKLGGKKARALKQAVTLPEPKPKCLVPGSKKLVLCSTLGAKK